MKEEYKEGGRNGGRKNIGGRKEGMEGRGRQSAIS